MKLYYNIIMFIFLIGIFQLGTVSAIDSAETNQIFKQNSAGEVKFICQDYDSGYCTSAVACNITVVNPNGTVIINNDLAGYKGSYYGYTLTTNHNKYLGTYISTVTCISGANKRVSSFNYLVTSTGDNQGLSSDIWRLSIILILLIVAGIFCFTANSFDSKRYIVKSGLFIGGLLVAVIAVGVGLNYAIEPNTSKLMLAALIIVIAATVITVTILFVYYFKAIIKAIAEAKQEQDSDLGI